MKDETITATLAVLILLVCATMLLHGCSCGHEIVYVMPDGARCHWRQGTSPGVEFQECNTGKHYWNPASWSEEQACK